VGSAPTTYTFTSTGAKTLYAFCKDTSDRISSSANANTTLNSPSYDGVSESHTGTTGSTSQDKFQFTYTPVADIKGLLVYVFTFSATKYVQDVSANNTALTLVSGGSAVDSAGEPGRVDTYFLGSGIPSGTLTITVDRTSNATPMYAVAIGIAAADDTQVNAVALVQADGTYAEQSLNSGTATSLRFAGGFSGGNNVLVAGANSTSLGVSGQIDFGSYTFTTVRETTGGNGTRSVGFTYASTDDRAAVHVAIGSPDVSPPTTTITTSTPQAISADSLSVVGTSTDNNAVSGCDYRIGSGTWTACTWVNPNFTCATSGYASGANTTSVRCYDAASNYSSGQSITVNYTIPGVGGSGAAIGSGVSGKIGSGVTIKLQ
jgi:hypothetical protein